MDWIVLGIALMAAGVAVWVTVKERSYVDRGYNELADAMHKVVEWNTRQDDRLREAAVWMAQVNEKLALRGMKRIDPPSWAKDVIRGGGYRPVVRNVERND